MKRLISIMLVLAMVMGSVGFVACTCAQSETTPPPSNGGTVPPSNGDTTPPPTTGGVTWNDMPVYPGANQVEEMSWTMPLEEEEEWSKVEWRYYETRASVSEVAAFYKSQMPGKGWQDQGWMDMVEIQWGYYTKNHEQDVAMIWLSSEEGKTVFSLMRATE
jgi:hypothetical protein